MTPETETLPRAIPRSKSTKPEPVTVLVHSDRIGEGDVELGYNLMLNFMHFLSETKPPPNIVIVMNAGVKLVAEGSDALDSLNKLEAKGTAILACTTCLNFFRIKDQQRVGKASNMAEIVKALLDSAKVITI